jgi:hypothetical protein
LTSGKRDSAPQIPVVLGSSVDEPLLVNRRLTAVVWRDWDRADTAAMLFSGRARGVLEEMHTAAELLLMKICSKCRSPAFAELVEGADRVGHLGMPLIYAYDLTLKDPARFTDAADLLTSLKDHRKRAKHQGTDEARAWLDRHSWAAGAVLEHLASQVEGSRR